MQPGDRRLSSAVIMSSKEVAVSRFPVCCLPLVQGCMACLCSLSWLGAAQPALAAEAGSPATGREGVVVSVPSGQVTDWMTATRGTGRPVATSPPGTAPDAAAAMATTAITTAAATTTTTAATATTATTAATAAGLRPADIELLAAGCANCHGPAGHPVAGIPPLHAREADHLLARMLAFRAGTAEGAKVMPRLMKGYDEAQLRALAEWFARHPGPDEAGSGEVAPDRPAVQGQRVRDADERCRPAASARPSSVPVPRSAGHD